LRGQPVQCEAQETAHFNPPPNQTCASYAGAFASASTGYLLNPEATSDCQYCPYTTGDDYLATLNISADDKWRDFGIFLAFVISNWALVYFFVWTVRVKGWSFGFGLLFGGLEKGVKKVTGLFSKKKPDQE
jgi:ATP-binding cassette, subfamily G (WHITE), member 2, SNQ2